MFDCALYYGRKAREKSRIIELLNLEEKKYALVTIHRAENTDDMERLDGILSALEEMSEHLPIVLPLHPRTRKIIDSKWPERMNKRVICTEPVSYLDMSRLEQSASIILTDSGGVQKEAYFYHIPCITLRDETEWVETLTGGWNILAGADTINILKRFLAIISSNPFAQQDPPNFYGNGKASNLILDIIVNQ